MFPTDLQAVMAATMPETSTSHEPEFGPAQAVTLAVCNSLRVGHGQSVPLPLVLQ